MECVKIKHLDETLLYLSSFDQDIFSYDFELPTNHAYIYKLETGEVVLIPAKLQNDTKCLFFDSEGCFEEHLKKDHFPVENLDKEVFEYDIEGISNIHLNIEKYQDYLNKRFSLDHKTLNKEIINEYYIKYLNSKRKLTVDFLALGALMGEFRRQQVEGKWVLLKRYGTYNPYFVPYVLKNENDLIDVFGKLSNILGSKLRDPNPFFVDIGFISKKGYEDAGFLIKILQ